MVVDRDVQVGSLAGLVAIDVPFNPAVSQTNLEVHEAILPARYQVHAVQTYCRTKAGTITAQVKIGGTTCLASAATFTAATAVAATLSATVSARRGTASNRITVEATTDGSGAVTDGLIRIWVRGYPAATE